MKYHSLNRNFKKERTRIYPEGKQDTYRVEKKYPEPTICRNCGSLFVQGRWTWEDLPEIANEAQCPACKRIQDHFPAGKLTLKGAFLEEHYDEIQNLIQNISKLEVSEHPLERLMGIDAVNGEVLVTTTGMHLARRIGDAISRAYQGNLEYTYEGDYLLRLSWERDT